MIQQSHSVARRSSIRPCSSVAPKFLTSLALGSTNSSSVEEVPQIAQKACAATMPNHTRKLLLPLSYPFHGSTALEALLMSSKRLATLCSSESWQCEGRKIGDHYHEIGMPTAAPANSDIPSACRSAKSSYADMMTCYSHYWDVQRPVFLEKSPCHNTLSLQEMREGVLSSALPESLTKEGVSKIEVIYLLLWRPPCLSELSSHAKEFIRQGGKAQYIEDETQLLTLQMQAHQYLRQIGEPVLVINYADLLWRTDYVTQRVEEFMPCLGSLDADYIPKKGSDVFPGNQWKIQDGTIREFGAKHESSSMGYDLMAGTCGDEWEVGKDALEYLRKWS